MTKMSVQPTRTYPINLGWIHFTKNLDGLAIDNDCVAGNIMRDLLAGTSMSGIVLVHVFHVFDRDKRIIDSDNIDVGLVGSSTHDKSSFEEGEKSRQKKVLE
jgi:hypothetical protein